MLVRRLGFFARCTVDDATLRVSASIFIHVSIWVGVRPTALTLAWQHGEGKAPQQLNALSKQVRDSRCRYPSKPAPYTAPPVQTTLLPGLHVGAKRPPAA